ncbi:MAG: C10 family peptidase [Alloprevotella sp.]|nr:C10 family peptidase [Alloprevotella sp.]
MQKSLTLILLLATCWLTSTAQTSKERLASKRAQTFFATQTDNAPTKQPSLRFKGSAVCLYEDVQHNFVLVSADKSLPPVLGYGAMGKGDMPVQLQDWLTMLDEGLSRGEMVQVKSQVARTVKPLLTTVRHQDDPYNRECPVWSYGNGTISQEHCQVGCVATALEQILTYYRRTYTLQQGIQGYSTGNYTVSRVPAGSSVNTAEIRDQYSPDDSEESTKEVATLSYWLGAAVLMQYGLGDSGAYTYRVGPALRDIFGLQYVVYADSYIFEPADFIAMIRNELFSKRPVYMSANTQHMGGHAFVIDGLDKDGFFHVNWGYGGNYDGYFDLSWLYTAEQPFDRTEEGQRDGYYINHEVVFIHPDEQEVEFPEPIDRSDDEIIVSSYNLMDEPFTNMYTRLSLHLTNTSEYTLTTPAVLFTSPQGAANPLSDIDYIGYGSSTLRAGETDEVLVHVRFNKTGARTLYISPDGSAYIPVADLNIRAGRQANVSFSEPEIEFTDNNAIRVRMHIKNEDASFRTGRNVIYEVLPQDGVSDEGTRHPHVLYLAPNEEIDDEVAFTGLDFETSYKLLIRSPWNVVLEKAFEIGKDPAGPPVWRNLRGARINQPTEPGVYIKNKKKIIILQE